MWQPFQARGEFRDNNDNLPQRFPTSPVSAIRVTCLVATKLSHLNKSSRQGEHLIRLISSFSFKHKACFEQFLFSSTCILLNTWFKHRAYYWLEQRFENTL